MEVGACQGGDPTGPQASGVPDTPFLIFSWRQGPGSPASGLCVLIFFVALANQALVGTLKGRFSLLHLGPERS